MRMRGRDDQLWFQAHRREHRRRRLVGGWLLVGAVFVGLLLVLTLQHLVASAQTANDWDGHWQWATFEERRAYTAQFRAEAAAIARAHCGEQYFGTICSP